MQNKIFPYNDLFDSHAHLSITEADASGLIQKAKEAGVMHIVDVANDVVTTGKILELKERFPEIILATAGIHPEIAIPGSDLYIKDINKNIIAEQLVLLEEVIKNNLENITMIGETGLDYYWLEKSPLSGSEIEKSKDLQRILFEGQLHLAQKFKLPLTVHARSSHQESVSMVKKFQDITGIFHSFTGTISEAEEILDLGFSIGINGIITYKSAGTLRDTIKTITSGYTIGIPGDLYDRCIYLETDSPFLLPANVRGKFSYNSPGQISVLWDFVYNLLSHS
jgi:TatD DNase family protein